MKALLEDVTDTVQRGGDFSTALARHPRSFPRIYVALIRASEKSGMMGKLIMRATNYLRDEQETVRRVKGALTYPCIMFGFACLTTVFLLVFVLPRFTTIYANKGAALPMPTKILMGASNLLVHNWYVVVPATLAVVVGGWMFSKTPRGLAVKDWLSLNLPLIGSMFRKMHLARGLRTIGTMAGAGVPLIECVETARSLTSSGAYQALWQQTLDQIQNGKPFSEPLANSRLVPGAISRMLASGEKGGKLAVVMEQVAGFSETEMKEKIAELTRYIEPAMILLMGALIGGVTLALLLPVFTISKVVAN
jgi:type IV pilus assembly protein PilC